MNVLNQLKIYKSAFVGGDGIVYWFGISPRPVHHSLTDEYKGGGNDGQIIIPVEADYDYTWEEVGNTNNT